MREFEYIFDRGLLSGLRRSERTRARGQTLTSAYNLEMNSGVLSPYQELTIPAYWRDIEIVWPFPMIIQGSRHSHMIISDGVTISVYEILANLDLRIIKSFNVGINARFNNFADFGDVIIVSGSTHNIVIDRHDNTSNAVIYSATPNWNTEIPAVVSCCNFKGQFVGGNVLYNSWSPYGAQYVVFSDIGSLNMNPTRRNQAGNIFLRTKAPILAVMEMLEHVIVYTASEIWALKPVTDPAPTFSPVRIASIGLAASRAVAGDPSMHAFLDYAGDIWTLDASLKLTKLGYGEFFAGREVTYKAIYDGLTTSWRFSNANKSYLLSEENLTEIGQVAMDVYSDEINYAYIGIEPSDLSALIVTDAIDFGYRGIKTIHGIELDVDLATKVWIALDYRFSSREEFKRTEWIRLNQFGQVAKVQAGTDFRVCVKFEHYAQAKLDYIKLRYKMSDLRGLRGVYAPPPRGQYVS